MQNKADNLEDELAKAKEFVTQNFPGLLKSAHDANAAAAAAQLETTAVREAASVAAAAHEQAAAEADARCTALQVCVTTVYIRGRLQ